MQKYYWFCIFMHFCCFTILNKRFVNILTIAFYFACFAYTFQSWYFSFEKAWVSGPKSMGFTSWNPWFHSLKPMLSDRNLMPFWKRWPVLQQKPLPRAAHAAFPSPYGGEWIALLTIVGRWSPCPVLQHPTSSTWNRLSHGGRGTEATVLLSFPIVIITTPSIKRSLGILK